MRLTDIQIRDPFVLPIAATQTYYLFGTTDKNCWTGPGVGFDAYSSQDLESWDGPFPAFRPTSDFWATNHFWAPEVFARYGRYVMMASFISPGRRRGTQALVADRPEGPYVPWSDGPLTPADCDCLDGTVFVDEDGAPWMVFCHEWLQIHDGTICAMRLSPDLKSVAGEPTILFHASEAPWARPVRQKEEGAASPPYVTDGPFLYRTASGSLLMLWSSFGSKGYAMGIARSASGTILGPWSQESEPIWAEDGGHGMIFRAFDGLLYLTLHQPNRSPEERASFHKLIESNDSVRLA